MRKKILLVDDEPDIVRTMSLLLRMQGYDVVTAESGNECIQKAYRNPPDLVILDVVLPDRDGFEIAEMLKKDSLCKKLPIILITAQTQKNDLEALKKSAADSYLIKPFDLGELKQKIERLIGPGGDS